MALHSINLMRGRSGGGIVDVELEYDDVSLLVTRIFGSNTGSVDFQVNVYDARTTPVTFVLSAPIHAHTSPSYNVPASLNLVCVRTVDDILPPIEVTGA